MGDIFDLAAQHRNDRVNLGAAVRVGIEMRKAQKQYFKTRSRDDLLLSKALEKQFDQMAAGAVREDMP